MSAAPKAGRIRATVNYSPGEDGEIVVLKPYWYADNGYETCSFPTKEKAVEFCWQRWRVPAAEVFVIGGPS